MLLSLYRFIVVVLVVVVIAPIPRYRVGNVVDIVVTLPFFSSLLLLGLVVAAVVVFRWCPLVVLYMHAELFPSYTVNPSNRVCLVLFLS